MTKTSGRAIWPWRFGKLQLARSQSKIGVRKSYKLQNYPNDYKLSKTAIKQTIFWILCQKGISKGGTCPKGQVASSMVAHNKTGLFDVLVQVFFQRFVLLMNLHFPSVLLNKKCFFSFGAVTNVIFLELLWNYPRRRGIRNAETPKCEGLSLPYLAARSNVKNVWDLRRNKKITSVDNFYYCYGRLIWLMPPTANINQHNHSQP